MDGYRFGHDVRVRFAETDAQGIAHHASFVVWLEVARVAYLQEFAGGYQAIRERGIEALTTAVHLEYERAATFDEVLTVWVRCRRHPRRAVPLRVRRHARRCAGRARLDGPRDGGRRHAPTDPGARLVRRGRPQGRGVAVVVDAVSCSAGGVTPSVAPGFAFASPFAFGSSGFGRGFVPSRTTVGSPT